MTRHLVIFARAPQRGRVKRRLAEEIGWPTALGFYRRTLARQIRRLASDRRWSVWLFVTPDDCLGHPAWRGIPRRRVRRQGGGDLGRRMKLPFQVLPPGPVVLVGSDIPTIDGHHIAAAFRLLGTHDLVFGPAVDGGFWLVGTRRRPRLPRLFAKVRWSTSHALADALAGLPPGIAVGFVDTLEDIDNGDAFCRLRPARGF